MTINKLPNSDEITAYDTAHSAMILAVIAVYRESASRRDGSYDYDEAEETEFNRLESRYEYLKSVFDAMPEPVRLSRYEEALMDAQAARASEEEAEFAIYAAKSKLFYNQPGTSEEKLAQAELEAATAKFKIAEALVNAPMMHLFDIMTKD